MIADLITADSFETVRDQIAAILAAESLSQQALATAAGEDPTLYKLRVYTERFNPWEMFRDGAADRSPVVNVYFDSMAPTGGDTVERQPFSGVYHIDCIGCGLATANGEGHVPGDYSAAINAQRAVRLVRNILSAGEYTYLGLRGTVARRKIESVTMFQPPHESDAIKILAARMVLRVEFNETSPQVSGVTLEEIGVNITRADDGAVLASAVFDYAA